VESRAIRYEAVDQNLASNASHLLRLGIFFEYEDEKRRFSPYRDSLSRKDCDEAEDARNTRGRPLQMTQEVNQFMSREKE
jgi:hypothetical protein